MFEKLQTGEKIHDAPGHNLHTETLNESVFLFGQLFNYFSCGACDSGDTACFRELPTSLQINPGNNLIIATSFSFAIGLFHICKH